jgi:predicted permease
VKRTFHLSEGKGSATRDVRAEIEFHLEMRAKEFEEQGMSPEEARRAAAEAFGDVEAVASQVRRLKGGTERRRRVGEAFGGFARDVSFALRTLRKSPGFAAAAIAILALALGATTAIFTVVDGVLLRPLPYAEPQRLAMVWLEGNAADGLGRDMPLSSGFYLQIEKATPFESTAAFRSWPCTVAGDGPAEPVPGARVTPSLFSVLGVRPFLGRAFTDSEAVSGAGHVALLSHSYWRRRFGASPSIVGQRIVISGEPFTVVGVLPDGFSFPRGAELPGGLQFAARTDVWTPLVFSPEDRRSFMTLNLAAVARLAPGVTPKDAAAALSPGLHAWLKERGAKQRLDYAVVSMQEQAGGPVRRNLLVLMAAVGLVLLIAASNVTNLLIARTSARQRELAVRAALGAGRGRIARQLATENVLLALAGTALGCVASVWAVHAMLSLVPGALPRADDVRMDARVVLVALGLAVVLGVAFGVAAAFQVRWSGLAAVLQAGASRATDAPGRRAGRRVLVALEISLSLVLLIGAAELGTSFLQLQRVAPGFSADHALVADVQVPVAGAFDPAADGPRARAFFSQLLERLNAEPGVVAAGAVSSMPLSGANESSAVSIVGRPDPATGPGRRVEYLVTEGRYFEAMRIRLLDGRVFDSRDRSDGAPVAVVNREFARRFLGGGSPVGERIVGRFELSPNPPPRTVVGLVDDVRQSSLDAPPEPQVYVPESQMAYPALTVVMRTSGAPSTALAPLRAAVKTLDGTSAVASPRTLEELAASSLARQRFSATILGIFAAAALVLSMVGLYGVIALHVGQRRREIGVRMALGARATDVLRLLLGEGLRITLVGVALGLAGAFATSRALRALVYGTSAADPAVFGAAALGVALVSLLATYLPARRAALVDPTVSLRAD